MSKIDYSIKTENEKYYELRKEMKSKGIKLTLPGGWDDGEIRVNFANGTEATAYYTNSVDDARATAESMLKSKGGTAEKKLTTDEDTKMHELLINVWNNAIVVSREPMWVFADTLIQMFGVDAVRNVLKTR